MKLKNYNNYEIYPETGQIWSYLKNKFVKGSQSKGGYIRIRLIDDNGIKCDWAVHRLVWTVVNGDIPEGMEVNHIDENKQNNSISNLNLLTKTENLNWGTHNERAAKNKINHTNLSKAVVALKNGNIVMYFPSTMEAKRIGGYNSGHIASCARGERKTHKGYEWRYV